MYGSACPVRENGLAESPQVPNRKLETPHPAGQPGTSHDPSTSSARSGQQHEPSTTDHGRVKDRGLVRPARTFERQRAGQSRRAFRSDGPPGVGHPGEPDPAEAAAGGRHAGGPRLPQSPRGRPVRPRPASDRRGSRAAGSSPGPAREGRLGSSSTRMLRVADAKCHSTHNRQRASNAPGRRAYIAGTDGHMRGGVAVQLRRQPRAARGSRPHAFRGRHRRRSQTARPMDTLSVPSG